MAKRASKHGSQFGCEIQEETHPVSAIVGEDMRELIFVNENIESQIKDQEERMEVCFLAFCCKFSPLRADHAAHVKRKVGRWLEAW